MRGEVQGAALYAAYCVGLLFCIPIEAHHRIISDSLMKDLNCDHITEQNILSFRRPDAFEVEQHLPIQNYTTRNSKGQCLGLAYIQRAIFYLARPSTDFEKLSDAAIKRIRRILNRLSPVAQLNGLTFTRSKVQEGLTPIPFQVFQIPERGNRMDTFGSFFFELIAEGGIFNVLESQQTRRNFRFEILWTGLQSMLRNQNADLTKVSLRIEDEISKGRMPLLGLFPPHKKSVHAVLAKKFKRLGPSHAEITLYDSNYPYSEPILVFQSGRFYPGPFGTYDTGPILVQIQDNGSMDKLQKAVFENYSRICKIDSDEI